MKTNYKQEVIDLRNEIALKVDELKSLQLWIRDYQLGNVHPGPETLNEFCDTLFNIYSGLEKI